MHAEPSATVAASRTTSRRLNAALWAAQVLLALAFGMAGFMKATVPIVDLTQQMVWPGDVPWWLVRFIGVAELAGALGLVLPALTRTKPALTPLAAIGLALIMAFASAFHLLRGEAAALPVNLTLGALAAFVAWGRSQKAPIPAR